MHWKRWHQNWTEFTWNLLTIYKAYNFTWQNLELRRGEGEGGGFVLFCFSLVAAIAWEISQSWAKTRIKWDWKINREDWEFRLGFYQKLLNRIKNKELEEKLKPKLRSSDLMTKRDTKRSSTYSPRCLNLWRFFFFLVKGVTNKN